MPSGRPTRGTPGQPTPMVRRPVRSPTEPRTEAVRSDEHGIVRRSTGWRRLLPADALRRIDAHPRPHAVAERRIAGAPNRPPTRRAERRPDAPPAAPRPRTPARPVGTHPAARRSRASCRRSSNASGQSREGRVGQSLRHVTYAAMPHGAKSLPRRGARAGQRRAARLDRARRRDRRSRRRGAAGLAGRSRRRRDARAAHLAGLRASELIRDESAARVASLAAWRSGTPRGPRGQRPGALPAHARAGRAARQSRSCSSRASACRQERVLRELVELGYEALPEVAGRGEFARRGGIVDVFPAGQPLPVRIEWFGDEIESLRAFDPADSARPRAGRRGAPAAGERVPARRRRRHGAARARWAAPRPSCPTDLAADLARSRAGPARRRGRDLGRPPRARAPVSTTSATRSGSSTSPRTSPPRPTSCGRRPTSVAPSWSRRASLPKTLARRHTPAGATGSSA